MKLLKSFFLTYWDANLLQAQISLFHSLQEFGYIRLNYIFPCRDPVSRSSFLKNSDNTTFPCIFPSQR